MYIYKFFFDKLKFEGDCPSSPAKTPLEKPLSL